MLENLQAEDLLDIFMKKAGFDPLVHSSHGSPTSTEKEIKVDKYDIAAYLEKPVVKSILKFIGNRMATKCEYDKVKKLVELSKSKDYHSILERKAFLNEHKKLIVKNSI